VHKKLLKTDKELASTLSILKPMNEFTLMLTDMERAGCHIDQEALDKVEKDFVAEKKELEGDLYKIAKNVMGDSPINLNSPECISQIVFGYKILDKPAWVEAFNIGTEKEGPRKGKAKYHNRKTPTEIKRLLNVNAKRLYKTEVKQCERCKGSGQYYRYTKPKVIKYKTKPDVVVPAKRYKTPNKCKACLGEGVYYKDTKELAGLGVTYYSWEYAAEGGFSVGGDTIDVLLEKPINELAKLFLTKLSRYNSVSTYLNNFVGAINRDSKDGFLHMNYNQCLTLTGRLSSTFHNLPRGNTFPVKKAIISRWEGGKILDCDFGQLEFRGAALLSQCPQAMKFIAEGNDAHAFSRDTLESYGHPYKSIDPKGKRQEAKEHTFKPLYGGMSGTEAQVQYFKYFLEYFYGIDEWQKKLGETAIKYKKTQTPSGRIYTFPYARRLASGRIYSYPQICNYPVQGFCFDIVMVTMLELWRLMKKHKVKSRVILTVHDSVTCDVFPGEEKIMIDIYRKVFDNVPRVIEERFGLECNVPLTYDLEIGNNWMEKEEVVV